MATMSIGRCITWLADQAPDRVAVRCGDDVLTRRDLDLITNRIARQWIADGIRVDDLITISLPNSIDFVLACVAAWKSGAVPQPLSPRLATAERDAVLAVARPARVIDGPLAIPDVGDDPVEDRAASSWKAPTSSGSTGRPKVIMAAAPATFDPEGRVAPFIPKDARQLVAGPLFHAAPFVYAMRGLMTGHELVLMPRFDAAEWLRLAREHRVTWGMLVPTMLQRILRVGDLSGLPDLEAILHLGARCPDPVKRGWIAWLGPDRITELYAGTESQGLAFIGGTEWLEHPGSVGRPLGDSRFRIVDDEGGECAPGERGEILMRRGEPSYRYVGVDENVRDGWHTLGDRGWIDADGYLYIEDRLDDLINTSGVKVAPADVEEVIDSHPEVRSSVVIGVPDDELGERVHALVDTDADLADVEAWVNARVDPEKRPRSYERAGRELRDDTGKVRRRELR
jgi:bile acid-coenzyme A ligase